MLKLKIFISNTAHSQMMWYFFIENPEENNKVTKEDRGIWSIGRTTNKKKKSKFLLKNIQKKEVIQIQEKTECEAVNKVKYLGIYLTEKNTDLLRNNYEKIWKEIKNDLSKWNQQKLSLMGRISVIKMNILPQISYFFRTIPVVKKSEHFKN